LPGKNTLAYFYGVEKKDFIALVPKNATKSLKATPTRKAQLITFQGYAVKFILKP